LKKQFHFGIISSMTAPESLPLSELSRPLLAALRSLPGTRAAAWLILEEDEYETRFGDGRFLYPKAASLDEAVARARLAELAALDAECRRDPRNLGWFYSLKRIELRRDESQDRLRAEVQRDVDERFSLQDVVRLLRPSPTPEA
jgi:hypothetical protein